MVNDTDTLDFFSSSLVLYRHIFCTIIAILTELSSYPLSNHTYGTCASL